MACGDDINARRLEALPWTRYCLHCQQSFEQGVELECRSDFTDRQRPLRMAMRLGLWTKAYKAQPLTTAFSLEVNSGGILASWFIALFRFFLPRVLFDPASVFKIGYPAEKTIASGSIGFQIDCS